MKQTRIFLLGVTSLMMVQQGFPQRVTLAGQQVPFQKVIRLVERQTGYTFWMESKVLKEAQPVRVHLRHVPLREALAVLLAPQPFQYTIAGTTVLLTEKKYPVTGVTPVDRPSPLQVIPVLRGRVTDSAGNALAGATIQIKGTRRLTQADDHGYFAFNQDVPQPVLQVSFTGFKTLETNYKGEEMNIILQENTSVLEEVYTTGYGTTRHRYQTGSVDALSAMDMQAFALAHPASNLLTALQGTVAGLLVVSRSGLPGTSFDVQVRGQNTLRQDLNSTHVLSDMPLFIIDGVPFSPGNQNINQFQSLVSPSNGTGSIQFNSNNEGLSPFALLNPNDIERVVILRDATSTSIYGSRGSNGVILITTRQAQAGKTRMKTTLSSGENRVTRVPQLLSLKEYLQMRRQAFSSDGIGMNTGAVNWYTDGYAPDLLWYDTSHVTDWAHYFLGGTARQVALHQAITGGTSHLQYLAGIGYIHSGDILPADFSDTHITLHSQLNYHSPNERLTLRGSANYSAYQDCSSTASNTLMAFAMDPDEPALLDSRGRLVWQYHGQALSNTKWGNPFSYLSTTYRSFSHIIWSTLEADYTIAKGLRLITRMGYNTSHTYEHTTLPFVALDPGLPGTASAQFGTNIFQTFNMEPQLEWNLKKGKGNVQIVAGATLEYNEHNQTAIAAPGYMNDTLLGSVSPVNLGSVIYRLYDYYYSGLFARVNYIWRDQYVLDCTARRDKSGRLAAGSQWGNFGSLSGAWIFTENPFFKRQARLLSYGKLSVSYGSSGNDNSWQGSSYTGSDSGGSYSWGVTRKLNIGMELAFLNHRLVVHAEVYRNSTGNQLVEQKNGSVAVLQNAPYQVDNSGWEFTARAHTTSRSPLQWTGSLNLTLPHNRLLSFPGIKNSDYANLYVVGQSLGVIQAVRYTGVNKTTGLFEYQGAGGSPTSTPLLNSATNGQGGDKVVTGNRDPRWYGGLSNSFCYQRISLDIVWQFVGQTGLNYLASLLYNGAAGTEQNIPAALKNAYWRQPGDQVVLQRLTSSIHTPAYRAATYFSSSSGAYVDASYARCKSISLGWSLPEKNLKQLRITTGRLYVSAENMFTISGYTGDPETQAYYGIPPLKKVVVGVEICL